MLSKSAARAFFLLGTIGFSAVFLLLTIDTIRRVPAQTKQQNLTEQVVHGKHLWERNNCMGCHTLLGEGAYYAPELTKVYERRGPEFIKAMLRDPQAMYPGQRRMVKYNFTDAEIAALVAFLQWIGDMDLNGFPPKPTLLPVAVPDAATGQVVASPGRPRSLTRCVLPATPWKGRGALSAPSLMASATADRMTTWWRGSPIRRSSNLAPPCQNCHSPRRMSLNWLHFSQK